MARRWAGKTRAEKRAWRQHHRLDGSEKVRWPNPTSAEFVAALKPDKEHYRCEWPGCDGWHVGSTMRRRF